MIETEFNLKFAKFQSQFFQLFCNGLFTGSLRPFGVSLLFFNNNDFATVLIRKIFCKIHYCVLYINLFTISPGFSCQWQKNNKHGRPDSFVRVLSAIGKIMYLKCFIWIPV